MTRRTRFLSGLVTLLAMTFSWVEGVLAMTCAPGMEPGSGEPVASAEQTMPDMPGMAMDAMPGHAMPAHADCPPAHRGADEHPAEDGASCPFALPGVNQGCAAAVSLPATSAVEIVPSPEGTALTGGVETEPHLLLGSALFHPPKP